MMCPGHEPVPTPPRLVRSARIQEAWAKALYEAWARYERTPLYESVAAEFGDVLSVEVKAAAR